MADARYANAFVASTAVTTTNGLVSGSLAVNLPPAAKAGDYLFTLFSTNDDTMTTLSGWTLLQRGTATPWMASLFGKVATASDEGGGTQTWTLSGSNQAPDCALTIAVRNIDPGAVVTAVGTNSTSTAVATPNLTIAQPSAIIHMRCLRRSSTPAITCTAPSGVETEVSNADTVAYSAVAYDYGMQYTTGTVNGVTITASAAPATSFTLSAAVGAATIFDRPVPNLSAPMRASL